jgi:hypothetical protein
LLRVLTDSRAFQVWNGFNVPAKLAEMKEIGYTHVLNCAKESQNVYTEHFRYMHLPLVDDPTQEIAPYLEHAFAFIDECRNQSGRVIVHCWCVRARAWRVVLLSDRAADADGDVLLPARRAGISRSATIVIGYRTRNAAASLQRATE